MLKKVHGGWCRWGWSADANRIDQFSVSRARPYDVFLHFFVQKSIIFGCFYVRIQKFGFPEISKFVFCRFTNIRLKAEVEHQLRIKDRNGDGRISLSEFREVEVEDEDVSHDIYNAELSEFRLYDRDLNQHLDRDELEGMISGMTYSVDRIRDFMYIVDENQDSMIDMGELARAYDRIALHDTISEIFWYKQEVAEEVFDKGKAGAGRQELWSAIFQ